jgi:hypothetical protein
MSIRNYLNTAGTNIGKIHGTFLAIDTAGTITKSYTANGSILLTGSAGSTPTLSQVLTSGSDANLQQIENLTAINNGVAPFYIGDTSLGSTDYISFTSGLGTSNISTPNANFNIVGNTDMSIQTPNNLTLTGNTLNNILSNNIIRFSTNNNTNILDLTTHTGQVVLDSFNVPLDIKSTGSNLYLTGATGFVMNSGAGFYTMDGAGLVGGSAGPSGQFLTVVINGSTYKIPLDNN